MTCLAWCLTLSYSRWPDEARIGDGIGNVAECVVEPKAAEDAFEGNGSTVIPCTANNVESRVDRLRLCETAA